MYNNKQKASSKKLSHHARVNKKRRLEVEIETSNQASSIVEYMTNNIIFDNNRVCIFSCYLFGCFCVDRSTIQVI